MEFQPVSSIFLHVRGRQLEHTFPGDAETGIWPVTAVRILKGWGVPTESEWPYIASRADWPPIEPRGIDELAKKRRILDYQRVRNYEDCRRLIQLRRPVAAAFDITDQWFDAPAGEIEMPGVGDAIVGGHQICIDGLVDSRHAFHFTNSWGREWGEEGFGWLPYEYFDRYLIDAWTCRGLGERTPWHSDATKPHINWGVTDYRGGVLHVQEVFDHADDEVQAWSFCVEHGGYLDIEDLYVRPSFRSHGLGRLLVHMISEVASEKHLPLRAWIPHGDYEGQNQTIIDKLMKQLGLVIGSSGVRWASFQAIADANPVQLPLDLTLPNRPRLWDLSRPTHLL
jgi:GNAT superfamily N-acetyltransferase